MHNYVHQQSCMKMYSSTIINRQIQERNIHQHMFTYRTDKLYDFNTMDYYSEVKRINNLYSQIWMIF